MRSTLLATALCAASALPAAAGTGFFSGAGTTSANFEKIGVGARPTGMGDAFVAVADDVNAVDWNPAGLASLTETQLEFMHARWMVDVAYEHFAYAQALGTSGGVGLSFGWIHTSGVARVAYDPTTNDSLGSGFTNIGEVGGSGFGFAFAYGNRLDTLMKFKQPIDITIGLAMKVAAERLDDQTDYGVGGALSMLWLVNDDVSFGMAFLNLGAGSMGYLLPMTLKIGGALHKNGLAMAKDKLTLAGDFVGFIETRPAFHLGAEYRWALGKGALMIRLGYRFVEDLGFMAGLTMGVGVDVALGGLNMMLDYAYVQMGDLGNTHRFGITLRL